MNDMNWEDLKYFVFVARGKTLEHASHALKVDKATISRRVKRLEDSLGKTLFERSRKGFTLTHQGEKLYKNVQQVDFELSKIENDQPETPDFITGNIRISVAEGFGASLMVDAIAAFHKANPYIEIDLVSGSGFLSLSRREADMAISLSRSKSRLIHSKPLVNYRLSLYAHKDYPRLGEITQLSDLSDHTLMSYIDDLVYAPELNYFENLFPNFSATIRCSSILAKRQLVLRQTGLAILPSFLATEDLVEILPEAISLERTFWLQTHRAFLGTARCRLLTNHLNNMFSHTL